MLDRIKQFYFHYPWTFYFVLAISVIALYLRIEPALFNLTHFSFDQGVDIILVKKIVVDHKLSLVGRYTGLRGVFLGPLYTWLFTIPFAISGGNPNVNQVFLAFLGIVSWALTLGFLLKYTNRKFTLTTFFLLAFSPAYIIAGQNVISPSVLTFLSIIFLWIIFRIITKRIELLPLLAFLLSLFFQFEIGMAIFFLPLSLLILLIFAGKSSILNRYLPLSVILFILPFLPQIVFDFRHQHLISSNVLAFFSGENTSLGSTLNLFERVQHIAGYVWFDWQSSLGLPQNDPIVSSLVTLTFLYGFTLNFHHRQHITTIIRIAQTLIVLFYISLIFYSGIVWPWYRAAMPLFFILLAAFSFTQIFTFSTNRQPSLWQNLARLIIVGFVINFSLASINLERRIQVLTHNYSGDTSTLANQQRALDSIYQDATGKPFALYVYTPPIFPYIWDYQLYWFAQPKYGYMPFPYNVYPQSDNPPNIYLLIENNDYYPDRIVSWRNRFISYGRKLSDWSLPGDLLIEKWEFTSEPNDSQPLLREVDIFNNNTSQDPKSLSLPHLD